MPEVTAEELVLAQQLEEAEGQAAKAEERAARAQSRNRSLTTALQKVSGEKDLLIRKLGVVDAIEQGVIKPPRWAVPTKRSTKGAYRGTVNLFLSDLHLDEVVNPAQMGDFNAYNREIALKRVRKAIESCIRVAQEFYTGLTYDGAVMLFGGDIFSGIIHQELRESNEGTILQSIDYWEDILAAMIERMASVFGNLLVPMVRGNHGRMSMKPVAKNIAFDSFEWLLYRHIEKFFKGSKHIKFIIPEGPDAMFKVYNHTTLLTHGDSFSGGSGIAGAMSPLLLGTHRVTRQQDRMGRHYDLMAVGHFHQYASLPGKGLLMNGANKGYDEYAYMKRFEPELAQQAFWITTPEHGVTFCAPIITQDRSEEGW